jgi:hypothetical protein
VAITNNKMVVDLARVIAAEQRIQLADKPPPEPN